MKDKGKVIYLGITALFMLIFLLSLFFDLKKETSLPVMAVSDGFSLSFIPGEKRIFDCKDFLLNSSICSAGTTILTVDTIPKGILTFDGTPIKEGDSIPVADISKLCYQSDSDSQDFFTLSAANFRTTVNMIPCRKGNLAPKGKNISFSSTHNITIRESFAVFDADGDEISIRITKPPEKGLLLVNGDSFNYTPFSKEKGSDSFSFVASDCFGNYSDEYTADISIEAALSSHHYSDTSGHSGAFAALKLSEKGVFGGEQIGSLRLFHPDKIVETGEFLMLLNTVTPVLETPTICFDTGLSSNEETKDHLKPYIKAAVDMGLITDYSPSNAISKEIAYHYAATLLKLPPSGKTSVIFPSLSLCSPEYIPSLLRLYEAGYVTFEDLKNPKSDFTRNDLARLLYAIEKDKN